MLPVNEAQVIISYYCAQTVVSDEDYPLQLQRGTSLVIRREERHGKPNYTPLTVPLVHKFNSSLPMNRTSTARKESGGI